MIRYALSCENGHRFESWFGDSQAFEKLLAADAVQCPECGSTAVEKALMTPQVATARKKDAKKDKVRLAANHAMRAEAVAAMRKIRDHVTENADYVGDKFPEEARKIHYEEAEPRGIYGEATGEEAKALDEEGVEFHPLPTLPEDQN
jgi:hypothetical protein